jgi:hypothetical protein
MVLPNKVADEIKKPCPYQSYNIYNDSEYSGLYSTRFIDPDNLCTDLQYLRELRNSNGYEVEYFAKPDDSSGYNTLLVAFLIIIYLICSYG